MLLAFVGVLGGAPAQPSRPPAKIAVVVSQEGAPYRDALAGLKQQLEKRSGVELVVVDLKGQADRAEAGFKSVRDAKAGLVITLGSLAARESIRRLTGIPLVAGMILSAEELAGNGNATGVFLQFPVAVELEWLAKILPSDRRIGVVYHSADSQTRITEARRLAPGLRLAVEAFRVDAPERIPSALESLVNRSDVLWGQVDPMVFNPETAQTLILFSFKSGMPLVGPSPPWVRAGALFALDRDYGDIGLQCAELAERVLDGANPGSLPPVPPRRVRLSVNRKTAEQLKIAIGDKFMKEASEVIQ